jgi:hypothetical protein
LVVAAVSGEHTWGVEIGRDAIVAALKKAIPPIRMVVEMTRDFGPLERSVVLTRAIPMPSAAQDRLWGTGGQSAIQ